MGMGGALHRKHVVGTLCLPCIFGVDGGRRVLYNCDVINFLDRREEELFRIVGLLDNPERLLS